MIANNYEYSIYKTFHFNIPYYIIESNLRMLFPFNDMNAYDLINIVNNHTDLSAISYDIDMDREIVDDIKVSLNALQNMVVTIITELNCVINVIKDDIVMINNIMEKYITLLTDTITNELHPRHQIDFYITRCIKHIFITILTKSEPYDTKVNCKSHRHISKHIIFPLKIRHNKFLKIVMCTDCGFLTII